MNAQVPLRTRRAVGQNGRATAPAERCAGLEPPRQPWVRRRVRLWVRSRGKGRRGRPPVAVDCLRGRCPQTGAENATVDLAVAGWPGEAAMARFLLYRTDSGGARVLGELVGEFTSLVAARSARDWDVLRQLEAAKGRRVELCHAIVDRQAGGAPRRQVCSVGQPNGWPVDAAELAATAAWLARMSRAPDRQPLPATRSQRASEPLPHLARPRHLAAPSPRPLPHLLRSVTPFCPSPQHQDQLVQTHLYLRQARLSDGAPRRVPAGSPARQREAIRSRRTDEVR